MRKLLSYGYKNLGGRSYGLITVPRRGALIKQNYRFLDNKRTAFSKYPALIIKRNITDPKRSGKITLVSYASGILTYFLESTYTQHKKLFITKSTQ